METLYLILAAILLVSLSFANGANDVSKPVATLAGAGVASVKGAVTWGTLWTVAGALAGLFWGGAMIKNISSSIYIEDHAFFLPLALSVSMAPILWVALATWRGWPVSTTHAVVGGLVGAGITAYGVQGIDWPGIAAKIFLPLLSSPFLAILLAWALTPVLEKTARFSGRIRICLTPVPKIALVAQRETVVLQDCVICSCDSPQAGMTHGITLSVDAMHWLTSGLLSFSRGLNDTPKLIAIILPFLMTGSLTAPAGLFVLAAVAMGAGSFFAGRKITETLGFKVTKMNHEQGFAANLVSSLLVIGASRFGLPVSTTHVSASSIMGVGLNSRNGMNKETITTMIFAWLVTAPVSGLFAVIIYFSADFV